MNDFNAANELLKLLEDERLQSVLYLVEPNQLNLNRLNKQRKIVNVKITANKFLQLDEETLIRTRKNIDNSSLDYRVLIFEKFHSQYS